MNYDEALHAIRVIARHYANVNGEDSRLYDIQYIEILIEQRQQRGERINDILNLAPDKVKSTCSAFRKISPCISKGDYITVSEFIKEITQHNILFDLKLGLN